MTQAGKPGPAPFNPFPGLRPFREEEEGLFFGRERQVDAMVDQLAAARFLSVLGASGAGKSSLVNCGLRPALHRGLMSGAGSSWEVVQLRPGRQPVRALAEALAAAEERTEEGPFSAAELIDTSLRLSSRGVVEVWQQAPARARGSNLLIVVDQFEELFRYRKGGRGVEAREREAEASAFVNLLLQARAEPSERIYLTLTMRSDFLGDCAQYLGLPEAINRGLFLVPRMTREERRAAIVGPAQLGGAEVEATLLSRLLNDVGDSPDQLSVLQHALRRTWSRWEQDGARGPIQLAHYEATGTMSRALDVHAEETYQLLRTEPQRELCARIFKALTDSTLDERGVRRPATLSALCQIVDATEAEVVELLEVFRAPERSFLMPPAAEPLRPSTVIDISHESLMRGWSRLNGWAVVEAASAKMYLRLAESADLHNKGRTGDLREPELGLAREWLEQTRPNRAWASQYHPGWGPAMIFLQQSIALREQEIEREVREEWAAQAAARMRARIRRWALRGLGTVAAVWVLMALGAWRLPGWIQDKIARRLDRPVAARFARVAQAIRLDDPCDAGLPETPPGAPRKLVELDCSKPPQSGDLAPVLKQLRILSARAQVAQGVVKGAILRLEPEKRVLYGILANLKSRSLYDELEREGRSVVDSADTIRWLLVQRLNRAAGYFPKSEAALSRDLNSRGCQLASDRWGDGADMLWRAEQACRKGVESSLAADDPLKLPDQAPPGDGAPYREQLLANDFVAAWTEAAEAGLSLPADERRSLGREMSAQLLLAELPGRLVRYSKGLSPYELRSILDLFESCGESATQGCKQMAATLSSPYWSKRLIENATATDCGKFARRIERLAPQGKEGLGLFTRCAETDGAVER